MAYRIGYEEDSFLKSLAPFEPHEIELKADNCTKVKIWTLETRLFPNARGISFNMCLFFKLGTRVAHSSEEECSLFAFGPDQAREYESNRSEEIDCVAEAFIACADIPEAMRSFCSTIRVLNYGWTFGELLIFVYRIFCLEFSVPRIEFDSFRASQ